MNRLLAIRRIRNCLRSGGASIGSWMQLPYSSVAEIMGQSGYDWVAIDMEHGSVCVNQLPDLFRALELGGTLPLARIARGDSLDCKQALDAGAGGVIVPMIETAEELTAVRDACRWPPSGVRGVGFSRANLYGRFFENYHEEAQCPLLIAMIENIRAISNLESILRVDGLDAIMIGPYDLSASMGIPGEFDNLKFQKVLTQIIGLCELHKIPCGFHLVDPSPVDLNSKISEGFQFIAYSIDAVFLRTACLNISNNSDGPKADLKNSILIQE